ncbi:glucose-1-phosphate adenylyltransferase [Paenibacillus athensensis]|uniref:Glucose-1-phosphate adenylyltransferase n=1 Tax=Paenibacillus athensensis TaxID=1967502 RepID=A0A4Y8PYP9_9BACL
MNKQECVAMLLAGGEGRRLGELTAQLAKPAVPFGGKYRIVDFALSNCRNSGITSIGVLTQYRPEVLNAHIGRGEAWGLGEAGGGATILERRQGAADAYAGTADAIYQNLDYLRRLDAQYVLIVSGDHIYQMDYRPMLERHKASGAHVTIAVTPVRPEEASRFGIMSTDEDGRVTDFVEKPERPASNLASMGVYIFNRDVLEACLERDAREPGSQRDFGRDVIPALLREGAPLAAYRFYGYWKDVGTVESLWAAHMDLLGPTPKLQWDEYEWPVATKRHKQPASFLGPQAALVLSRIGDGVRVHGHVQRSVLSDGVKVGAGSRIVNSVIMPGARIGDGVVVQNAIIGAGAVLQDGVTVGEPDGAGVTLIGPKRVIARRPAAQPMVAASARTRWTFA